MPPPLSLLLSLSLSLTLQLTICMQLQCSLSIIIIFRCYHFATDHLHAVKMLIFYHSHFQLSSLCNWPSSGVCPLYNILSLSIKGTSSVLWSSANFCSISQNMHYKAPVAAQHWKTNKVAWTWKDDWPPWRTSTYKRPFTWEGNSLVIYCLVCDWPLLFTLYTLVGHNWLLNAAVWLSWLTYFCRSYVPFLSHHVKVTSQKRITKL